MMIPLTHFINSNCHSMFLVHLVLHYNEYDSLIYANEKNENGLVPPSPPAPPNTKKHIF